MFLELSRNVIRNNFGTVMTKINKIEKKIDSLAGSSEKIINNELCSQLLNLKMANLGKVHFKKMIFEVSIDVERELSHGKICQMGLPNSPGTELGDLFLSVDHILVDLLSTTQKRKIIGGACSIIQTKKENYAKKGLPANQLYLMTQWPKFKYKGQEWEFKILPDLCSFYLFVLDPSSKRRKTNLLSSSMVIRLLCVEKNKLLNSIKGKIPLPNTNLIGRDNNDKLPLSLTSFLFRSLYLSIGSQSIELRNFIRKNFFPSMEEVEDCVTATQSLEQDTDYGNWFPNIMDQPENDEDIFGVRLKVITKRIE